MEVAFIIVKTLFADRYPYAVFQRFLMSDNGDMQHRADKAVSLVRIADNAEITVTLGLVGTTFVLA